MLAAKWVSRKNSPTPQLTIDQIQKICRLWDYRKSNEIGKPVIVCGSRKKKILL